VKPARPTAAFPPNAAVLDKDICVDEIAQSGTR
jgi:hypothetical protein